MIRSKSSILQRAAKRLMSKKAMATEIARLQLRLETAQAESESWRKRCMAAAQHGSDLEAMIRDVGRILWPEVEDHLSDPLNGDEPSRICICLTHDFWVSEQDPTSCPQCEGGEPPRRRKAARRKNPVIEQVPDEDIPF